MNYKTGLELRRVLQNNANHLQPDTSLPDSQTETLVDMVHQFTLINAEVFSDEALPLPPSLACYRCTWGW